MRGNEVSRNLAATVALLLVGAVAAACGSSGSSTPTATPTAATSASAATSTSSAGGGESTVASTPTSSAETPTSSGVRSSGSLPSDPCGLLTDDQVSQIVGQRITQHVPLTTATLNSCQYDGTDTGVFSLSYTSASDDATAHAQVQVKASLPGYTAVSGVGDEALQYKMGATLGFEFRKGSTVVILLAKGSATAEQLQTAATSIVGQF